MGGLELTSTVFSLDGTGLLGCGSGQSVRMNTLAGSGAGGGVGAMSLNAWNIFDQAQAASLDTHSLGFDGEAVSLVDGQSQGNDVAGTPFGTLLDAGGFVTGSGYDAVEMLSASSLDVSGLEASGDATVEYTSIE